MKVTYNLTDRKPFVKALEVITGEDAVYKRTPTYAYEVGCFTITREGNLEFDDMADPEYIDEVLKCLEARGFVYESSEYHSEQPAPEMREDTPVERMFPEDVAIEAQLTEDNKITVSMLRSEFTDQTIENLNNLMAAKGRLIKKALGIQELPIEITEDRVKFHWFSEMDIPKMLTYTKFITALRDMAKSQKRISPKEKESTNEKYAFRCFLLRLGFIGDEFKKDRKILLENLEGSAAFKTKKGEQKV